MQRAAVLAAVLQEPDIALVEGPGRQPIEAQVADEAQGPLDLSPVFDDRLFSEFSRRLQMRQPDVPHIASESALPTDDAAALALGGVAVQIGDGLPLAAELLGEIVPLAPS